MQKPKLNLKKLKKRPSIDTALKNITSILTDVDKIKPQIKKIRKRRIVLMTKNHSKQRKNRLIQKAKIEAKLKKNGKKHHLQAEPKITFNSPELKEFYKKVPKNKVKSKKISLKKKMNITTKKPKLCNNIEKTKKKAHNMSSNIKKVPYLSKKIQKKTHTNKSITNSSKKLEKQQKLRELAFFRLEEDKRLFEQKLTSFSLIPGTTFKIMRFYQPEDIEAMEKKIIAEQKKEKLRKKALFLLEKDRKKFEQSLNKNALVPGSTFKIMRFYQPEDIEAMEKKIIAKRKKKK